MKRFAPGLTLTVLLAGLAAAQSTPRTDPLKGNPSLTGEITYMTNKADVMKGWLPAFEKLYPKVKVTLVPVGASDLRQKITTSASANQMPADVMQIEGADLEFVVRRFPNLLMDLTAKVKKYQGGFSKGHWQGGTVNNKVYGLPLDNSTTAMFYRADLFKKAGINPATIKTWDDYIAAGVKLQKMDPDIKMTASDFFSDDLMLRTMMQQATGGYYFNKDGEITINSAGAQKALATLKEMWDKKILLQSRAIDTTVGSWKANRSATILAPAFMANLLQVIVPEQKGLWGVAPLPGFGKPQPADFGTTYATVAQASKSKDVALAFVEWLATVGGQRRGFNPGALNAYLPGSDKLNLRNAYFATPNYASVFIAGQGKLPYLRYTTDSNAARQAVMTAQGAVLNGAPVAETLGKAARDLANQTGRDLAK
ncbi:ABC transporter substrate-binding protein [Deinococcus sp. YIM 77859]|uniref:ABC transporter substrate-binding protein n=1 Tax=Deinococcus sp. YIM 77859 TaxID=1540221 RepID=UPI000555B468|nr:sugar ABC transporter substrate-binding protein [Deinococcus sp. YIM 77859]